jgi:hypothetical protein
MFTHDVTIHNHDDKMVVKMENNKLGIKIISVLINISFCLIIFYSVILNLCFINVFLKNFCELDQKFKPMNLNIRIL